jgi:hypothetical protein
MSADTANDREWDENGYVISLDSGELEEGEEAVAMDIPPYVGIPTPALTTINPNRRPLYRNRNP